MAIANTPTTDARFSLDGRTVVASSADNTVRVWDITDRNHPASGNVDTDNTEAETNWRKAKLVLAEALSTKDNSPRVIANGDPNAPPVAGMLTRKDSRDEGKHPWTS